MYNWCRLKMESMQCREVQGATTFRYSPPKLHSNRLAGNSAVRPLNSLKKSEGFCSKINSKSPISLKKWFLKNPVSSPGNGSRSQESCSERCWPWTIGNISKGSWTAGKKRLPSASASILKANEIFVVRCFPAETLCMLKAKLFKKLRLSWFWDHQQNISLLQKWWEGSCSCTAFLSSCWGMLKLTDS